MMTSEVIDTAATITAKIYIWAFMSVTEVREMSRFRAWPNVIVLVLVGFVVTAA